MTASATLHDSECQPAAPEHHSYRTAPLGHVLRRLLAESESPLGAYELVQRLAAETGRRAYANTVYRAISPLVASGEVLAIITTKKWTIRRGPGATLLLLCDACGGVTQIPWTATDLRHAWERARFRAAQIHLEVHGRCDACRATKSTPRPDPSRVA